MNQLPRSAMIICALAASLAANASDVGITIKVGDSERTISRKLVVGQTIEIDERKTLEFKITDGCEGISVNEPPTRVVTGLLLKIDAVQDIGDAFSLRISFAESALAGKRSEQYRPGCTLHWPMATVTSMEPAHIIVGKGRKEPIRVFDMYTAASGKQTAVTLQVN